MSRSKAAVQGEGVIQFASFRYHRVPKLLQHVRDRYADQRLIIYEENPQC